MDRARRPGRAAGATPASEVLIFANGSLIGLGEPSGERPDVAKLRGREALRSGFKVEAIVSDEVDADDIRAFAVVGRKAFELPRF